MDPNKDNSEERSQNLRSLEFPALPTRPTPQNIVPIQRSQSLKRPFPDATPSDSQEPSTAVSSPSDADDSTVSGSSKSKVIKVSYQYRDPGLPSLEALPSLTSLPSFDFSPSEDSPGFTSSFNSSLGTPNGGLGSLGLHLNNARLDSLPDFGFPGPDSMVTLPYITGLPRQNSLSSSTQSLVNTVTEQNGPDFSPNVDDSSSQQPVDTTDSNFKKPLQPEQSGSSSLSTSHNGDSPDSLGEDKDKPADADDWSEEGGRSLDLHKLKGCKKDRTHRQFFLIKDLKVSNLPREIQHEDSLTFLGCLAKLVVQITVTATSSARESTDDYQGLIGTDRKRFGSGFIASVDEQIVRKRCKRPNCPHGTDSTRDSGVFEFSPDSNASLWNPSPDFDRSVSTASNDSAISLPETSSLGLDRSLSNVTASPVTPSPKRKHYYYRGLNIHTNRHIIYDQSEADSAIVKFFYETPDGDGVVEGHVSSFVGLNPKQDHVVLNVMSHDKTLFPLVERYISEARSSYDQMVSSTLSMQRRFATSKTQSWVAVISHPHGLAKHLSFGHVIKEDVDELRVKKYYDAATCPGSSGGLVITPSLLKMQWPGAVHRMYDNKTKLNVTWDARGSEFDVDRMMNIHQQNVQASFR